MSGGFGSRLGSAGLMAGVVIAMMAASSGVAAATEDLGDGCIYYAPGEAGGPTKCPNWNATAMNLSERNFTNADLSNAKLSEADLRGTNFTNANLSGAKALSPKMSPQTQLRGAIVDNTTYLQGLVEDQEVTAVSGRDTKPYFIVSGATPGLPTRFRPPAIPQGVSIDECTSLDAKTVRKGQDVGVKMLPPGTYRLKCTFFTADRQNGGRGTTLIGLKVNDSLRSQDGGN